MNGGSYYDVLGVNRDAQYEDIAKGYRKMALKYHPELNKGSATDTRSSFNLVTEAYAVLKDPQLRARYDDYGESGLKEGGAGLYKGGYAFSGDADDVFKNFFGVSNPFQVVSDSAQGMHHAFFAENSGVPKVPPQCPSTELTIACTLEELFKGAQKAVTVNNEVTDAAGALVRQEETVIPFSVAAGLPNNSRLKFAGKGTSRDGGYVPGDVYITVNQTPHDKFTRKGDDLYSTHAITLEQALCGFSVDVHTLDGRTLSVFVNDIVHTHYTKVLRGEGMPVYRGRGRGDLVLSFETTYPKYLNDGQKKEISRILNADPSVPAKA